MDPEQQFQSAAQLFQAGDLTGAEDILAALSVSVPSHPDILHFLGLVRLRAGKAEAAIDDLKQLTELKPDWPQGYDLLGCALRQSGRKDAAIRQFRKAISLDPDCAPAYYNMGNVYRDNRQFDEAARLFNKTILIDPDNVNARFNLGQALYNLGKLSEASAAFRSVVEQNPADLEAVLALVQSLMWQDDLMGAKAALLVALETLPDMPELLDPLADLAMRLDDFALARQSLEKLLRVAPRTSELLRRKTMAEVGAEDMEAAMNTARAALDEAPDDPDCRLNMAHLLERLNRTAEAGRHVSAGLAQAPDHPGLTLVAARLERREGQTEEALRRLKALSPEAISSSTSQSHIHFELGRLYTAIDRPGDAIENFALGNAALVDDADMLATMKATAEAYLDRAAAAYRGLDDRQPGPPPTPSAEGTADSPVFVIGFPRSGTTLLDQILGAHPATQVLEEQPTLSVVRDALVARDASFPASLFDLSDAVIGEMREVYFDAVARCIDPRPGATLIDKLPLNIVDAGLINRLFPEARFLLALRHPCDVCLSCFMQPFTLNQAMAHFTRLDDTVAFYDRVMDLWHLQRDVLDLAVHEIRYEEVVTDLEPVARGLLDFLDLPWDAAVLDPTGHARKQTYIATSSYHQVVEEVNTRAVDRWRRFEIHLTPHFKRLKPHLHKFGYTTQDD